jgi:nitronate monooxygenase
MTIRTRLTERLRIRHPVLSAPMAWAAGGRLAAAVSNAGGLGLIGGGYGDRDWLTREWAQAGNAVIGCGFITWSLDRKPELLQVALANAPRAVMLSFGDPRPYAEAIRSASAALICQVQTVRQAREALEAGADILVAQGSEAGGHSGTRATLPLVPEIVDLCAAEAPETLVLAAGGIADGRGLAASLMLGADGVLVGSRFWAAEEALVHPNALSRAVQASGDETLRSSVVDVVRGVDWPPPYAIRTLRNGFTERWHGQEEALAREGDAVRQAYADAAARGDMDTAAAIVGEAVGLIREIRPAAAILEAMVADAETWLVGGAGLVRPG